MTKFGNIPTTMAGVRFDSMAESRYYLVLLAQLDAGDIKDLHLQPRYELLPGFSYGGVNGRALVKERPTYYVADFDFLEVATGKRVVIDVKGGRATQTPVFRLKAKLFRSRYPDIELRVVEA